jgi:membrane protease YdiL (CAAX protease family)
MCVYYSVTTDQTMTPIFRNAGEKRIRAGWRILLFLLLFFSFSSLIFIFKPLLGEMTKRAYLENYSLLIVSVLAFGATLSVWLSRKWWDKKTFRSLGLKWNRQALKDLLFGFLLSGLMAGIFFGMLLAAGLLAFEDTSFQISNGSSDPFDFVSFMSVLTAGSLALILLEHILVGYWEELVFRGYLFQNMIEGMGLTLAILISCILYGLIHAANPNAGLLSSLIIVGFGFLRIYGYLSTKLLWLSIGMHIGWNFFQGPVFGFAASGHDSATLLNHRFLSEKEYLTGGAFGPEGSILILPILVGALLAMRWYARRSPAV